MADDILSAPEARRLVLHCTGLTRPPGRRLDADGLMGMIHDLGFVQVDSIAWVERAHQMILFSRNQTYKPALLRRLLEKERRLFENWTHDAAIIPTDFYPYWHHRFQHLRANLRKHWAVRAGPEFEREVQRVKDRIIQEGRVKARDFNPPESRQAGGWWDWHHGKTALEYLWRTGELAICRRENFQKCYDLAARVLPHAHDLPAPASAAVVDWACREALARLGFGTPAEIAGFFALITTDEAKAWCEGPGRSHIRTITVAGAGESRPRKVYALDDVFSRLQQIGDAPKRLRILNPFDPLLRDRKRLRHLFAFDYRIEIFVPEAKRQYGYYIFPILEGEKLIGRVDMKAERAASALSVTGLWLEPGVRFSKGRRAQLEAELGRVAKFTGLERTTWQDGYFKTPG